MSTFKPPVRSFNFTDARLIEIAEEKIAFAQRDAAELLTLNITAAYVTGLQAQVAAFAALPSDETELGEQTEATEEKNIDADTLRDSLKSLRSAASRTFGNGTPKYKQFGLIDLDDFSDSELLRRAIVAQQAAVTYAAPLATKGFDAAAKTELDNAIDAYIASLKNQALEIGSRDTAQETRVLAANALYNELENELCEAGKNYWRTRSAAKYNDYIIYTTESGGALPDVIEGDSNAGSSAQINVTSLPITAATPVLIEVTYTPATVSLGFAFTPATILPPASFTNVSSDAGILNTTAGALGFTATGNQLLVIQNATAVVVHYKVTIG